MMLSIRGTVRPQIIQGLINSRRFKYDLGNSARDRLAVRHGNHDVHCQPLDAD